MLTIALIGQKGGSGKSTCCVVLAQAALARSPETRVLIIDADGQGSAVNYVAMAHENFPEIADRLLASSATTGDELQTQIEMAMEIDVDYVLIDTAGKHDQLSIDVIGMADRVIIPLRPVKHEYLSQLATVGQYETVKEQLEADGETAPPCGLMLTDFRTGKLTGAQAEVLVEVSDHPLVLPFVLPHRASYETMVGSGMVLTAYRDSLDLKSERFQHIHATKDIAEADTVLTAIEGME